MLIVAVISGLQHIKYFIKYISVPFNLYLFFVCTIFFLSNMSKQNAIHIYNTMLSKGSAAEIRIISRVK